MIRSARDRLASLLAAGAERLHAAAPPAPSTIGCPVCGRALPFTTVRMFTVNGSTHAEIDVAECNHNGEG